jgi:hypothetical protein
MSVKPPKPYNFESRLNKILDFSAIRVQKLLEILQYTFIYLILAFITGIFLEKLFPADDYKSLGKYSTVKLLALFSFRISIMVVMIFYIYKIGSLFPFAFHTTKDYKPGMKGEARLGASVVMTFALYKTQPSLIAMFAEISRRFGHEIKDI